MYIDYGGRLTVDGLWFDGLEEALRTAAKTYRAPLLLRVAETVDDVPAPLMAAYAKLFSAWDEDLDEHDWAAAERAAAIEQAMLLDINRINPRDATEYVSRLLRRAGCGVLD
jgi:hypothetical protein